MKMTALPSLLIPRTRVHNYYVRTTCNNRIRVTLTLNGIILRNCTEYIKEKCLNRFSIINLVILEFIFNPKVNLTTVKVLAIVLNMEIKYQFLYNISCSIPKPMF